MNDAAWSCCYYLVVVSQMNAQHRGPVVEQRTVDRR
jgi:hypothetical protein